ncbi:PGF-CTERM sorting domain-containing protein [Salinigranum sp. GCM10025319]|uniref:PGF-CTERM sorting domain-containing protein n=1 Tax=Salinigranum sp. GCM10025319 TaxID=3252687 RepID=UPI003618FE99
MTDYNDKIRAVVLAALMVLSVFAGTVAFAGTASAAVSNLSDASAADVTAGSASVTQEVSVNVTNDGAGSPDTVTLDYSAGGNPTSASVSGDSDVSGTAAVSGTDVTVDLAGANSAPGGTLIVEVTHDLSTADSADGVTLSITGTGGASTSATFDVNAPAGGDPIDTGSTVYLGDTVNLNNYASTSFTGEAGEADGTTASVSDLANAEITGTNGFVPGRYEDTASPPNSLFVTEPSVSDVTLYRGSGTDGADITDGSTTNQNTDIITVEADWNFNRYEGLDVIVEDEDGLDISGQVGVGADTDIAAGSSSTGTVEMSNIMDLDTGEYTVTVEGDDDLDGASRSATFTIRDESQTISLDQSTVTQGDNAIATVTGTPGEYGLVRIESADLDNLDGNDADSDAAADLVFANTGDVQDRRGTGSLADADGDWVGAVVDLDDGGDAQVRINTNRLDTTTVTVEFVELDEANTDDGNVADGFNADSDDEADLTVEERSLSITSAPSVVRIGEEFTVEGTAPESDEVKAYARIDQDWVPLVDEGESLSEDRVDSNGEFAVDIDSGSEISLPDSYRIAIVADPTDADGDSLLGSDDEVDSDIYGEFDTKATVTVRTVEGDLTARLSSSSIAANVGDEVTLEGTALGQGDDVRAYLIGPRGNYLDASGNSQAAESISVDENEFDEDYSSFNTRGTYTFIVIGQGRDGQYSNSASDNVGFDAGSLRSDLTPQQAVEIINDAYTGAGSDDQIVELTLQAENPSLSIDDFTTDGQVAQGEVTISGTSNREDGTVVFIEVLGQNENVIASDEAEVNGSTGEWSTTIDMSDVETGTYTLRADDDEASASLEFELVEELSTPTETPEPDTETDTPEPDTETDTPMPDTDTPMPDTDTPEPTTSTQTPGFGVIVALIALIGAALLAYRRD